MLDAESFSEDVRADPFRKRPRKNACQFCPRSPHRLQGGEIRTEKSAPRLFGWLVLGLSASQTHAASKMRREGRGGRAGAGSASSQLRASTRTRRPADLRGSPRKHADPYMSTPASNEICAHHACAKKALYPEVPKRKGNTDQSSQTVGSSTESCGAPRAAGHWSQTGDTLL